ncbi:excinuclease ABC subunit UvrA [Paenibacillus tarimensis]
MREMIVIKGARENNLRNISLTIPKHKLVVLTGPSGSGKSTLAMDTLQRECQRQYMESMGMVTDSVQKPKVDSIAGLSPSISIGQHRTNRNPRSTVGTVTDMYTYLRVLYAKLGERGCPSCGAIVAPDFKQTAASPLDEEEEGAGWGKPESIHCSSCNHALPKLTMTHFSFNKPEGACECCSGLGQVASLDLNAVFDEEKSLRDGCVRFWYEMYKEYNVGILAAAAKHYGIPFDLDQPLKEYDDIQRDLLYYGVESEEFRKYFPDMKPPRTVGAGKFEGVVTGIWRRYREKDGESGAEFFRQQTCPECMGQKLKRESREVLVAGVSIAEVSGWPLGKVLLWLEGLHGKLTPDGQQFLEPVWNGLSERIRRVIDVGLSYLSLHRQAITLSGGEAQRLRLASLLGSGLTGVLYILDEPSAGLHARDTRSLIHVLKQLRDLGNTVLVIEHDVDMMRAADHIIEMGPGAGSYGGSVVGTGTLEQLIGCAESVTGTYLREQNGVYGANPRRRKGNGKFITIEDAHLRNLRHIHVSLPLGCLISVTGVSGSGKSTMLFEILAKGAAEGRAPEGCRGISGLEFVGSLITVDQSPLGRMQRSNVATFTEMYALLRQLFAGMPEAKKKKLTPKHFSFNTSGGRCEACQGLGVMAVHMHFLPELEVRCPACRGRRFQEVVLSVTYNGYTISEILDMTVQESLSILKGQAKITGIAELLCEVGLGYLQWGQAVTTLSGGEGQRLKLARQLNKKSKNHTLYLLDEPTTGLHPADVRQLLVLLNKLVDAGNTVICVEHQLDLVQASDWVVDIGPEGGEAGGFIVAEGTPEEVAGAEGSYTGQFLKVERQSNLELIRDRR